MASLRSAKLIANLSLHGIPWVQDRAPSQVGTLSAKGNSGGKVSFRIEEAPAKQT
jgi:hypothetical protein